MKSEGRRDERTKVRRDEGAKGRRDESAKGFAAKSRRDDILLTVDFNLRTRNVTDCAQVPQGRYSCFNFDNVVKGHLITLSNAF